MARRPNYNFEWSERDRQKALKIAEKSSAKRVQRELTQSETAPDDGAPITDT